MNWLAHTGLVGTMENRYRLFFGDIHAHSGYSLCYWPGCGEGSLDQLYSFARDQAGLDFCAATNHGFSMTDEQWEVTQCKTAAYNEPERFVTLLAYEWTSALYGHYNVYYLGDEGELIRCTASGDPRDPQGDTPKDLFRKLKRTRREAMVVPHHPAVTQFRVNWDYYDGDLVRLAEITSLWGNFEYYGNPHRARISDVLPGYYLQDALARGYRLGFLGGTDSHDCRPGMPTFGGRRKPNGQVFRQNPLGVEIACYIADETANWRGIAAVYAEALSREAIYSALWARRCYATTGARIELDFRVSGHCMGEQFQVQNPELVPRIELRARGTHPIAKIEIVRNGDVIYGVQDGGCEANLSLRDYNLHQRENYYYARVVQADGHRAWSSPVWVDWDCLPDLEVKAEPVEDGLVITLQNQGRSDADEVVLRCYRRDPFPVHPVDPEPAIPEGAWGITIHRRPEDERVRLSMRCHGDGLERSFTGQIALVGWHDYRVRDIGFECAKYGGDLYTDDGAGQIRWNVMTRDHPKGLDIYVTPEPYVRCSAFVDPAADGEKLATRTYVAGQPVVEIPFEVLLADFYGEAEVGTRALEGPPAGKAIETAVACTADVACVSIDSKYGSPIVLQIPSDGRVATSGRT